MLELFLSGLFGGWPHPACVLLAAISTGMVRSAAEGALVAFAGGLLLDVFAGPPLGRQMLALIVAALPVFLKHTDLDRRTVLAPVLAGIAGTCLYWLVLGLVDASMGLYVPWLGLGWRWILPTMIVNGALAWPAVRLAQRLTARRGPRLVSRS